MLYVYGCIDPRLGKYTLYIYIYKYILGISDKMTNCQTCKKKLTDCAGHFGYIQLELPVFHAGYFKHTLTIMQCICKKCSRVLVPPANRAKMLKSMQNPRIDALMRGGLYICI
jgi:DNA-directed RNA polymerase III subunit RPC1